MSNGHGIPSMPMGSITRVLGRIKEIEQMIYQNDPARDQEEPKERFQTVLDSVSESTEMKEAPGATDGARQTRTAARKKYNVPSNLEDRLAMWEQNIQDLSAKYEVDPDLVRAVMRVESGGNPNAISSAGAIGLMQLMPGTARGLGVDPHDPLRNLEGGIKYLAQLSDKYNGDFVKTLAAYNAGSGRVDSYGGVPPFPETQRYVKNVLALYKRYSKGD